MHVYVIMQNRYFLKYKYAVNHIHSYDFKKYPICTSYFNEKKKNCLIVLHK